MNHADKAIELLTIAQSSAQASNAALVTATAAQTHALLAIAEAVTKSGACQFPEVRLESVTKATPPASSTEDLGKAAKDFTQARKPLLKRKKKDDRNGSGLQ
jgi:hypothetical protein